MRLFLALPLLALLACEPAEDEGEHETGHWCCGDSFTGPPDDDLDGWTQSEGDCDDDDPAVNPDAAEVCDGVDNNCDGEFDEGVGATWYADTDGDGYGDPTSAEYACAAPAGYVEDATDCDDGDATMSPTAEERCDTLDNDCDDLVDEEVTVETPLDADGDGFGHRTLTETGCDLVVIGNTFDCDDADATEPVVVDVTRAGDTQDGSYGAPFGAIQTGIDASGMCVVVYPGTYLENVDFGGKEVEVFSTAGPEDTFIDASGSGAVVSFANGEGPAAEPHGFTLTGGGGTLETTVEAHLCDDRDEVCATYWYRYYGGGLDVFGATPTLWDLEVAGNELPAYSYAVIDAFTEAHVYSHGGGIFLGDADGVDLTDVNVRGNSAHQGGGIFVNDSVVRGSQSWIGYNAASDGAGVYVQGGSFTATNTIFVGNTATESGGAAYADGGTIVWGNVTAVGNAASTGSGVAVMDGSTFVLQNSVIAFGVGGAGVLLESSAETLDADYSDLYGNVYEGVTDPTGVDGNLSVEPGFVSFTDNGVDDDDFALDAGSALVDAGNPGAEYCDGDGSVNDVGAFGGPAGVW